MSYKSPTSSGRSAAKSSLPAHARTPGNLAPAHVTAPSPSAPHARAAKATSGPKAARGTAGTALGQNRDRPQVKAMGKL